MLGFQRAKTGLPARPMFSLVMVVLIILLLSLACARPAPGEKEQLIYRASYLFTPSFAPAFLGVEKGFWADEGIDLVLKPNAGIANTQLVGTGVEFFVDEGYGDVIEAVQAGMPVKGIFSYTQQSPVAIISRADNPIRHPKDLEGKTLVSGPGSGSLALLPAVMKAAGADFSKVKVSIVDWGVIIEMLMLGKADAMPNYFSTNAPQMEAKGVKPYVLKYSDYGINVLGAGLVASDKLIASNPDLIKRFVRALSKSWEYTAKHPDEAVDIFVKNNPDWDRTVASQALSILLSLTHTDNTKGKKLGWMAKEDWEQSQKLMIDYLELKKNLPAETYYTNEFIP